MKNQTLLAAGLAFAAGILFALFATGHLFAFLALAACSVGAYYANKYGLIGTRIKEAVRILRK